MTSLRTIGLLAVTLLAALPARGVQAATPAGGLQACTPAEAAAVATYEKGVRDAKPGDPLFVPHPFPQTPQDILDDYRFQWLDIFDRAAAKTPEMAGLIDRLKAHAVRFEILRGEDWSWQRCGRMFPFRNWFLIRVHARDTGAELSRAVLSYTGLWANAQDDEPGSPLRPITGPVRTAAALADSYHLALKAPTFVTLHSDECFSQTNPCVALNSPDGSVLYIATPVGHLYRVLPGKTLSRTRDIPTAALYGAATSAVQKNHILISIGADTYAPAELVTPPKP